MSSRELIWLAFVENEINKSGFISKQEAINAGAIEADCSTLTTRRYCDKYTSHLAPFILVKRKGVIIITRRKPQINSG